MIRVSELSKFFGGTRALGPVSFVIEPGEAVGFLGLNGAGKTTLLRILACDLRPSGGAFAIDGVDGVRDPHGVRRRVGFLPEEPPLYRDMRVGDYLRFAGTLRGMTAGEVARRIPEVEALCHTTEVHGELLRHLSHGYRQRVALAQAIVHQPDFVILDEPTKGLDPAQIVDMRALIQGLKARHTILISSHILPEIRETCDRLLVLGNGRLVASGTEAELSARLRSRRVAVAVRPAAAGPAPVEALESVAGVQRVTAAGQEDGAATFVVEADGDVRAEICRSLVEAGHGVIRLDRADSELESAFLELVHGGSDARG